jgi:hypothetical protein
MSIVSQVAEGMQDVLTEASDISGRRSGFIQRQWLYPNTGFWVA